jgi:hypothetical protein
MEKLVLIIFVIAAMFVWYGFKGKSITAKTGNETSSDIPPTNLTGANLNGVSLDGVILCNTIMPDGTINNISCKN